MHGEIKDYRQPMATSFGIILGFMLNFLAVWANTDVEKIQDATDVVVLASILAAVVLFIGAIIRILSANLPEDPAAMRRYYRLTLRLYALGIAVSFLGLSMALFL